MTLSQAGFLSCADRDVARWVRLHCGERSKAQCKERPGKTAEPPAGKRRLQPPPTSAHTSLPQSDPWQAKHKRHQLTNPSPGHSKRHMRSIKLKKKNKKNKQLKGRGRPEELTYGV